MENISEWFDWSHVVAWFLRGANGERATSSAPRPRLVHNDVLATKPMARRYLRCIEARSLLCSSSGLGCACERLKEKRPKTELQALKSQRTVSSRSAASPAPLGRQAAATSESSTSASSYELAHGLLHVLVPLLMEFVHRFYSTFQRVLRYSLSYSLCKLCLVVVRWGCLHSSGKVLGLSDGSF